jgi:SAM-dependent methyltransferase
VERESPRADPIPADPNPADSIRVLIDAITDADRFVSATWSGALPGATPSAERVTLRPVDLKAGRRVQFSVFDGRTTVVTNVEPGELAPRLKELFDAGYASTFVRTLAADLQLSHSRAGTARLTRHRPSASAIATAHDRPKARLLDEGAPFLHAVGITDQHGRIKPTARAKHRQVERFVEILSHTLDDPDEGTDAGAPISAVDLGCGAGVLTLATYHYLTEVRGRSVTMTGVDTKADLIDRLNTTVAGLGWDGLRFEVGTIADHQPTEPPDLVLALHACDTATDDALARAVGWRSRFVLAAPCCQHDLQAQIDNAAAPPEYAPLLRHGIVRERLGDLLTDSLRAELFRAHGYRTDVIEFVSTDHTAKNLMIRAVRTDRPDPDASNAAERLAATWGVTPALAARIGYRP